jgi:hypothetical protein
MTQSGLSLNATSKALNTPEAVQNARAFVNDPARIPQSFTDFIHSSR